MTKSSKNILQIHADAIVFTVPVTGAVEGVRFELNCSLENYSGISIKSITWTTPDNVIDNTTNKNSLVLNFDPLTSRDRGTYTCSIVFDTSTLTKSYELIPITGKLDIVRSRVATSLKITKMKCTILFKTLLAISTNHVLIPHVRVVIRLMELVIYKVCVLPFVQSTVQT